MGAERQTYIHAYKQVDVVLLLKPGAVQIFYGKLIKNKGVAAIKICQIVGDS